MRVKNAARAAQLQRGDKVQSRSAHHAGMAELKRQMGDPRPEGLMLSLTNWDSPSAYDGYTIIRGERKPYRLSADPADYAWETRSENEMRKPEEVRKATGAAVSRAHKGKQVSDETKKKMSDANLGKRVSEKTKAKISKTLKGIPLSPERVTQMSIARKGIPWSKARRDAHEKSKPKRDGRDE